MLYVKFGKNRPHGFRGDVVWKWWTDDGRWRTDGRRMPAYTISSAMSLRLRWANNKNVSAVPDDISERNIYWSKVLPDQPARMMSNFQETKTVQNLKTATIKQVIIHLSKLLNFIFRKSHYVTFFGQQLGSTLPKYAPSIDHCWLFRVLDSQISLSSIGFEWEKVSTC